MKMALEGIRVVDLSRLAPGPYCSMILGDLGAEVIRVESADPRATVEGMLGLDRETTERLRAYNPQARNKKSIVIDLRQEAGRAVFYRLAKVADVILEEFRPGVVKQLGVDYETIRGINPKIVYCSLTGYGQKGPYSMLPGHDVNYLAVAGALSVIKDREGKPVIPSNILADMAGGGMHAALGILAALVARSLHGVGQHVDCAMTDGVVSLMHFEPMWAHFGASLFDTPFYGAFKTRDGKWLSTGNLEPWFWANFCKALDREDLIPTQADPGRWKEVTAFLEETFRTRTRQEWFEFFREKNVCVAPVLSVEEAQEDPHLREREMFVELDHEKFGKVRQVGISVKLSETPGRVRSCGPMPGSHTDAILGEIGYTEEEVSALKETGAVA
jgi:crotonobetainyl-CoA:carnitine CoA-transferase CaiB-like acyl-CoA transferase